MSLPKTLAVLAGAATLAVLLSAPTAWSAAKEPPACAAIHFRGLPTGMSDGVENAGLYHSRFGLIEVKADVKGGQAQNYFVTVNNVQPRAAGALPKSIAACAATKHLPAPDKPLGACTGDRFSVLVDHAGDKRYVLLYARQGTTWHLCSAGAS